MTLPRRVRPYDAARVCACPHCGQPMFVRGRPIGELAIRRVDAELAGCSAGLSRFFQLILRPDRPVEREKGLAQALATTPDALASRFRNANLPGARRYMDAATLMRAAWEMEDPTVSLHAAAQRMGRYGPNLCRFIQRQMGISAVEFRAQYSGEDMLERFLERGVRRFRPQLLRFDPLCGRRPGRPSKMGRAA